MLVESAFFKIPEILLTHESPDYLYEANITNLLTQGVVLELNARNIDNPLRKIHMEKRYDPNENIRCDIYLDFASIINEGEYSGYGIKSKNWIEAKYFGGINRNRGNETTSENAGAIMNDIFRTIYHTHVNGNFNDGKYSLNVFNDNPSKYLAFGRRGNTKRDWIYDILKTGISNVHFDLSNETDTIKKLFGSLESLVMDVELRTTSFEPLDEEKVKQGKFYGYLSQIISYRIEVNGDTYEHTCY